MHLTNELLAAYKGGQIEVQNQEERYLYRGEIETIAVANDELQIRCSWIAKGEGFPPLPKKWVNSDKLNYSASLEIYRAFDIGPGEIGGNRLSLSSMIVGETVVLFPPDSSKLDPAKVEGLEIAKK